MLRKLCPLRPGAYHVGVTKVPLLFFFLFGLFIYSFSNCLSFKISYFFPCFFSLLFFSCLLFPRIGQLFLKEDIYQLLECKRERTRQLAALTLQRYARMFFIRKRFLAFRKKIVTLQAQCRGFLTRSARPVSRLIQLHELNFGYNEKLPKLKCTVELFQLIYKMYFTNDMWFQTDFFLFYLCLNEIVIVIPPALELCFDSTLLLMQLWCCCASDILTGRRVVQCN